MNGPDVDPPARARRVGGLSETEAEEVLRRARPIATGVGEPQTPAVDIVGTDCAGASLSVPIRGPLAPEWTLLVFLSTSCLGCADLWALVATGVSEPATGGSLAAVTAVVAVTRGPDTEDPSAVAKLCPSRGRVVMSDDAWVDYRVSGAPFFVVVHRDARTVLREGVAWGVDNVLDQFGRARLLV